MSLLVSATAGCQTLDDGFVDLGPAVRRNALYNHLVGRDASGAECYYQLYRGDPWFLLAINPQTGESQEFLSGRKGNPYGFCWASNDKLYVASGGGGTGDLFVFDPRLSTLKFLGNPAEGEAAVWWLTEAADGNIYGGTYGNSRLVRIDPRTDEISDLGSMSQTQKYVRTLAAAGRYVYANSGPSRAEVWAYHIDTGGKTQILPEEIASRMTWGTARTRADGNVYLTVEKEAYRVDGVALTPVPPEELPPVKLGHNQFAPTNQQYTLADGTRLFVDHFCGPDRRFFRQRPGAEVESVAVTYTGTPIDLWALETAPDGRIFGTTRSPITLFEVDPQTGSTQLLGDPIGANGQVYGWTWLQGKLHMAAYGGSRVTVWDPARPWAFGAEPESNPRYLGSCGIGRPASLIAAPDGRHLLAGGVPGYGSVGGVLTVIDPQEPAFEILEGLLDTQSIASMASIPGTDLVCIGTTWRGGSASETTETPARLLLWNFRTRQIEYEAPVATGEAAIVQMLMHNGRIYCTTGDEGRLLVFDPQSRQVIHEAPLGYGKGTLFGLRYRPADGMLYAISGETLVRIDPDTFAIESLATLPGLSVGLAISEDAAFVGRGDRLFRLALPPAISER